MAALKVWNDPGATFCSGAFSLLFATTWNALVVAKLDRLVSSAWSRAATRRETTVILTSLERSAMYHGCINPVRAEIG